jgi:alpha-beta hydrolase superfamily lysophospholipase
MKRALLSVGLLVVVGALVFFAGPRARYDSTLRASAVPEGCTAEALEAWLASAEARIPGLRPGTGKCIVWADPATKSRTRLVVVYLHGYSATRQEVAPLADELAGRLGANLFYTRLTGHGQDGAALAAATVNDWFNDAAEALAVARSLGDRIILVGTSTGAALALWWAATQPTHDLHALILMSPNFGLRNPRANLLLGPWGRQIGDLLAGRTHTWTPYNEDYGRYWTNSYPTYAGVQMLLLARAARSLNLEGNHVPTLVLHSGDDHVISLHTLKAECARLGGSPKRIVQIDNPGDPDQHVLAGRILSPAATPLVLENITRFLAELN